MSLSDPNATPSALAAAALLRSQPANGRLLSGAWISTTPWTAAPASPMPDFSSQYLEFYAESGGANGSGFPSIMGIEDFSPRPGAWAGYYGTTVVPHCQAGGLAALLFVPAAYSHSYGPNNDGWPIMGKGTGYQANQTWFQGLGKATSAFSIGAIAGFGNGTGTIPCSNAGTNFPTSGILYVETSLGYAIVTYTGIGSGGTSFTGCSRTILGSSVKSKAAIVDYSLLIPGTPQNAGLNTCLDDLAAQIVFLDQFNIAPMVRILWEPNQPVLSATAWFIRTPKTYYQALWSYFRNYIIGSTASIPVAGADGVFTTSPQPVVATGVNWVGNAIRPTHNALWTFTDIGGKNGFSTNSICAPRGMVDVVGFDFYTSAPADWATFGSTPSSQWDSARAYYWSQNPSDAIMGFTETGYRLKSGSALDWLPALTQFTDQSGIAYGPAFFISWTDQGATHFTVNRISPFDKTNFSSFWNHPPMKNLSPGAWPMSAQSAGGAAFS